MTPFYLIILFSLIAAVVEYVSDKPSRLALYTLSFVLIIFAGTREIGIDPDSDNYQRIFDNYSEVNFFDGGLTNILYEPLSKAIFFLTSRFGFNIETVFLFYAVTSIGLKGMLIRKISPLPMLSMYLFCCHFFLYYEMVQIRAALAMGIALFACLISWQKPYWSLGILLLASTIHVSAILGIAFYIFKEFSIGLKKYFAVLLGCLVIALIFLVLPSLFLELLAFLPLAKAEDYLEIINSFEPASIYGITMIHLAPALLGLWLIDRNIITDGFEIRAIQFYSMCIPYYLIFLPISVMAYRSSEFFQFAGVIVIPILLKRLTWGPVLFVLLLIAGIGVSYFTLHVRELFPIGYISWIGIF